MTGSAKQRLDEALALSPEERVVIADSRAACTGEVDVSADWRAELERRLEELARGDVDELVSWTSVRAQLAKG